jgi:hypothetical protein
VRLTVVSSRHALSITSSNSPTLADSITSKRTSPDSRPTTPAIDGIFDAQGTSKGSGTAGTANIWTGNHESKDNLGGGLGH